MPRPLRRPCGHVLATHPCCGAVVCVRMPVGSFSSESRTLYVGGLPGGRFATKLKERLAEHFGEWGELENINYIPRINAAFVRYRLRANAEFARVRRTCVCVCARAPAS